MREEKRPPDSVKARGLQLGMAEALHDKEPRDDTRWCFLFVSNFGLCVAILYSYSHLIHVPFLARGRGYMISVST